MQANNCKKAEASIKCLNKKKKKQKQENRKNDDVMRDNRRELHDFIFVLFCFVLFLILVCVFALICVLLFELPFPRAR